MSSPMMVQMDLESGSRRMTTWVDIEKAKLCNAADEGQGGSWVKIKDSVPAADERWWQVLKIYDIEIPKDQLGVRGFKNNI